VIVVYREELVLSAGLAADGANAVLPSEKLIVLLWRDAIEALDVSAAVVLLVGAKLFALINSTFVLTATRTVGAELFELLWHKFIAAGLADAFLMRYAYTFTAGI
jgi:hypothetical protein